MDETELTKRLAALKEEHRDLDNAIDLMLERIPYDQLQIQRLKKRKLRLKDEIRLVEDQLTPDIIA